MMNCERLAMLKTISAFKTEGKKPGIVVSINAHLGIRDWLSLKPQKSITAFLSSFSPPPPLQVPITDCSTSFSDLMPDSEMERLLKHCIQSPSQLSVLDTTYNLQSLLFPVTMNNGLNGVHYTNSHHQPFPKL